MKTLKAAFEKIDKTVFMIQAVLVMIGCALIDDAGVIFGVLFLMWSNNLDYKKEDNLSNPTD